MSYLGERGVLCVGNGWHFCTPVLMNMSHRLITFVFKKSSQKKYIHDYIRVRRLKGFGGNTVGPALQTMAQHYFTIGPIDASCYPGSGCFNVGPASNTIDRHWTSMGCDTGPTLNRYWVGRPTLCVPGTLLDAYTDLSAMVVEGIGLYFDDIQVCLLGSNNNYILDI